MAVVFWLIGVFCIAPILIMFAGAFWHEGQMSLAPFTAAFSDPARSLSLFLNSTIVMGGAVFISLLLGVPTGFLCFRTNLPFRRVVILGCLLAACVPVYITATCWFALTGMRFWLYNAWGAAWISGLAYTPLVSLITGACFALADRDLEDATALDAGKAAVFWRITLPMSAWGIGMAGIVVAILSAWDITVTDILMVRTFAEEIFTQFQLGAGPRTAAAVSLPLTGLVFLMCAAVWLCFRGHGEMTVSGVMRPPATIALGWFRWPLFLLVMLGVLVFFATPLAALIKSVGNLRNLAVAWRTADRELLGTLRLTPLAATICVVPAIVAAWALARAKRGRWIVCVWLILLISAPAPIVGIGLIKLLNHGGLSGAIYDSEAGLVIAYVIRTLPFAVFALLPGMRRIPNELEESITLDGGSWIRKITSVVIPMTWQSVVVAWLLAFVLSLSEMGASFLVVPPGRATLSVRFFTLIHYGVYPDAAGICLILLGIVGLVAVGMTAMVYRVFPVAGVQMSEVGSQRSETGMGRS